MVGEQIRNEEWEKSNRSEIMIDLLKKANWFWLIFGFLGLSAVYVLHEHLNLYAWLHGDHEIWRDSWETLRTDPKWKIVLNKGLRYTLNDLFSIAIIHGLFKNKTYTQFAVYVLLFGLFVLLPSYLGLIFYAPSGYSSMISHFHRIIMNPVLMMLLIPYYYMMEVQKKEE